jgi:hypothetical protein
MYIGESDMIATVAEIKRKIDDAWDSKQVAVNWLELELLVRAVYQQDISNSQILDLISDIFAAYTKRGGLQ